LIGYTNNPFFMNSVSQHDFEKYFNKIHHFNRKLQIPAFSVPDIN